MMKIYLGNRLWPAYAVIILAGLGILALPFLSIGFDSDAFGLVFFSAQSWNWGDFWALVMKPIQYVYLPANELASFSQGFLTYFRPFMTLSHLFVYQLVGNNPAAYFVINVLLHSLTACGLFKCFSWVVRREVALLLSLIFLFHPPLTPAYVGVLSHVVPTYLFLVWAVIAYRQQLVAGRWWWQLVAAGLLLGSLLCYEIGIVFPVIAVLYHLFFTPASSLRMTVSGALANTWILWLMLIVYLGGRLLLLGNATAAEAHQFSLTAKLSAVLSNWHQALKPFWGMKEWGKLSVIMITSLVLCSIILRLIRESRAWRPVMFYTVAFFITAWPVSLITADGRYFYPAIPFFCLLLFEGVQGVTQKKWAQLTLLSLVLGWGIYSCCTSLSIREYITHQRDLAFQSLEQNEKLNRAPSYILLGTLHCYRGDTLIMQQGMMQAMRLFLNRPEVPVYHITEAKLYVVGDQKISMQIEPIQHPSYGSGYRLISPDPDVLFVMIPHGWLEEKPVRYSMGTIVVNHKTASWKADDISFFIDDLWREENQVILTFDTGLMRFTQLDE